MTDNYPAGVTEWMIDRQFGEEELPEPEEETYEGDDHIEDDEEDDN